MLTPDDLRQIKEIIERHHAAFVVNYVDPEALGAELREELEQLGLYKPEMAGVKDAYLYGALLAAVEDEQSAKLGLQDYRDRLRKDPLPLSPFERQAVQWAGIRGAEWIVGLGNRVAADVQETIIDADQALEARTRTLVREKTALNIARREMVSKLKSDLGWATADWARDWDRIAVTEKQNSMLAGQKNHYRERFGDPLVFRRPGPDACKDCKNLLAPGGIPRVFRLSVLEGNGSNYKVKRSEWKPVVGAIHPNCACPMSRMPPGWGFDEETGDLVPGGELPEVYETWDELERALRQEHDLRKSASREGLTEYQGIPIVIENPAGSVRRWTAPDGSTGETWMAHAYGYVMGTNGLDDDEVDVYLGPDPQAPMVWVIDQQDPSTGRYDEQKAMLGFRSERQAVEAYRAHLDEPDRFQVGVQGMDMDAFKRWLQASRARSGELGKGLALVIDLSKAKMRPEQAARGDEAYGDRNPTRGVAGINLEVGNLPVQPRPNKVDIEDLALHDGRERLVIDMEPYHMGAPPVEMWPLDVDRNERLSEDERVELENAHQERLDELHRDAQGPQNHVAGVRRNPAMH